MKKFGEKKLAQETQKNKQEGEGEMIKTSRGIQFIK